MKVGSKEYRGIHFVQLDDLPDDQAKRISKWVPAKDIFKIRTEQEIIARCIQYKTYEAWYNRAKGVSVETP